MHFPEEIPYAAKSGPEHGLLTNLILSPKNRFLRSDSPDLRNRLSTAKIMQETGPN